MGPNHNGQSRQRVVTGSHQDCCYNTETSYVEFEETVSMSTISVGHFLFTEASSICLIATIIIIFRI